MNTELKLLLQRYVGHIVGTVIKHYFVSCMILELLALGRKVKRFSVVLFLPQVVSFRVKQTLPRTAKVNLAAQWCHYPVRALSHL